MGSRSACPRGRPYPSRSNRLALYAPHTGTSHLRTSYLPPGSSVYFHGWLGILSSNTFDLVYCIGRKLIGIPDCRRLCVRHLTDSLPLLVRSSAHNKRIKFWT